ncbi:uncharacterized protein BT62DRAFT_1000644 [Guyanagaster necrorhizus]|uniref:Uncharacterized protein n=1 Tax=Guyanagaster necrorhizus TaxID=856835 RepID=A0A9P8AXN1_9AGAR|nr:uncharacterized protein BT62DRAFT_1000644 [Guyanagaster necrorhizus MCA 3950]KAG7451401.1 hypothetical protein BT62DRAFT_1000644 [Guyanagaster necrorhizus MCA 3950]
MRQSNNLPFQQHLAHDTLYRTGSSIRNTDLSFLFHGDVALHHLNRSLSSHLALHPQAITNLANAGLTHLNDIAFFSSDSDNHTTLRLQPHSNVSFQNATTRAQERWPQISLWIRNITLKDLVDGFMAMGDINNCVGTRWTDVENRTCVQSADTHNNLRRAAAGEYSVPLWFLVLPPLLRMQNAHNLINAYHAVSIHPPLPSYIPPGLFDSDASIILPVSAFRTPLHHGEAYGLIALTIHQYNLPPPPLNFPSFPTLYTDHLNSTHIISSAFHVPQLPHQWSSLPGRSLYRWLLYLLQHSPPPRHPPTIVHTPAHTNSSSRPSQLNASTDFIASRSQTTQSLPPPAPLPTLFMDPYILYSPKDGYIETKISSYILSVLISV